MFVYDDYDDDDTEDTFSGEFDDNDSPTSSRSDGPSPPSSVMNRTVRRKSTNARYFPTSEASLEKFFRYEKSGSEESRSM